MKIVKNAEGKLSIKITHQEWKSIGKKANWSDESDGSLDQFERANSNAHRKEYLTLEQSVRANVGSAVTELTEFLRNYSSKRTQDLDIEMLENIIDKLDGVVDRIESENNSKQNPGVRY